MIWKNVGHLSKKEILNPPLCVAYLEYKNRRTVIMQLPCKHCKHNCIEKIRVVRV